MAGPWPRTYCVGVTSSRWVEVADGVLQGRYQPLDVNVCVVRGSEGLLVVDTRSSHQEGAAIRADLRALGDVPVRAVVNTHAHYDHSFGNQVFGPGSDLDVPIYGHERVPAHLDAYERPMVARWRAGRGIAAAVTPEDEPDWSDLVITPPTVLVGDHHVLDLGDMVVELLHLGRGHTDNDLLLHVPDTRTWLVGDLLEESGPPLYGSGSVPLDWPGTILRLVERLSTDAVLVPGHGVPVSPDFARAQGRDLSTVADLIRELFAAGVPVDEAVTAAGDRWPFPVEGMAIAVADGFRQLQDELPAR
jgi:glyoxylase-like metal-dependent hydrolase (beta-lactamase superfamily II)